MVDRAIDEYFGSYVAQPRDQFGTLVRSGWVNMFYVGHPRRVADHSRVNKHFAWDETKDPKSSKNRIGLERGLLPWAGPLAGKERVTLSRRNVALPICYLACGSRCHMPAKLLKKWWTH